MHQLHTSTTQPPWLSKLNDKGLSYELIMAVFDSVPVWHRGEVVARVDGRMAVAKIRGDHPWYVGLLDNGETDAIQDWHISPTASTPDDWRPAR